DITCGLDPGPAFYPGNATSTDGKRFTPDPYQYPAGPLRVPVGSNVQFTNTSYFTHSVMAFARKGGAPLFRSPSSVEPGHQALLVTRSLKPGVYAYFCTHHPDGMFGLIEIVR
ncbi:MAG: hypothetical protein LC640_11750, partial [Frankia sp.]|nr:hypothetical protein [Frankia sp.]